MSITFAEKLAQIPGYQAGAPVGQTPEDVAAGEALQLASNESPFPPHPAVVEAIAKAAASANRYPDPGATLMRTRIAERYETDPSRVAVSNGSCEILLAGAAALCEPGAEIVFAWPSFSIYPYMAPLSGARELRVPLDGYEHDLDAIAAEITAATQIAVVCNPNNPTGTFLGKEAISAFLDKVPSHVTVMLDEAYIEFQTVEHPDTTVDLLGEFPNLVLLRTFSKVHGLAGPRAGFALCSPGFRAAIDAVRQPYSVNAIAQAAAAEAILHVDDVLSRVERNAAERLWVEEQLDELELEHADSQTNFSWVSVADRDEAAIVSGLAEAGVLVRAGTALGGPGHFRVSYGTRPQNEKFISELSSVVQSEH